MIYIELLVIEDFILNYIILYGTGTLLNRHTKFKKIFLSSSVGTISLLILFITSNQILINFVSLIFGVVMSLIAFNYKNIIYTIKNIIYMYLISIFLAGTIYLIKTNYLPKIDNYILKIIILVIIAPIITYLYIKSINKIKINNSNYYTLDIYLKDKPKITVISFLDTGNKLKDPYTHKPIILISKKIIDISDKNFLLVPYNTIDSHGLLKCFSPIKIYIKGLGYAKKVLIGIVDEVNIEGADCILNPKLLERTIK